MLRTWCTPEGFEHGHKQRWPLTPSYQGVRTRTLSWTVDNKHANTPQRCRRPSRKLRHLGLDANVILLGRSRLIVDYFVSAIMGPHADRYSHLRTLVLAEPLRQTSEKMQPNALLQGRQEEALCLKSRREKLPFFSSSTFFPSIVCFQTENKALFQGICQIQFPHVFPSFFFNQGMKQRRKLRAPWALLLWSW